MLEPGAEMEATPLAALPMEAAVNELPAEAFAEEESSDQFADEADAMGQPSLASQCADAQVQNTVLGSLGVQCPTCEGPMGSFPP